MLTHRCVGSLSAGVSVRYDKSYDFLEVEPAWNLRCREYDSEYGSTYMSFACEVKWCPFCAEKLEVVE